MQTDHKLLVMGIVSIGLVTSLLSGCGRGEDAQVAPVDAETTTALPQGKVAKFDRYTLRVNAIRSNAVPEGSLAQYGIDSGADIGLLNVVVLERQSDDKDQTVAAEVSARQEGLTGLTEEVEMRSVEANDYVSYIGPFALGQQDHFRFTVEARPEGGEQSYTVKFDARFKDLE